MDLRERCGAATEQEVFPGTLHGPCGEMGAGGQRQSVGTESPAWSCRQEESLQGHRNLPTSGPDAKP